MKYKAVVYKITCLPNDVCYFGCTDSYTSRISTHLSQLRAGKHANKRLQRDYDLYGAACFRFEIIQEFTKYKTVAANRRAARKQEKKLIRETYFMESYNVADSKIPFKNFVLVGKTRQRVLNIDSL
jgi:predicted GIY-YIG superfamily endonuclease